MTRPLISPSDGPSREPEAPEQNISPAEKDLFERAEKALEAANTAAGSVRNLYITFLLLGTYVGIIIASTTDEQLLQVSPVTLPLLDVELPIIGFYSVIPWLLVLLHFNLLLQFALLREKLHDFSQYSAPEQLSDIEAATALQKRLVNFPLIQLLSGPQRDRFMRLVLILITWITVIVLPLWLLLWAQIRFLPYHDVYITWGQRLAVIAGIIILCLFWPRIVAS